MALRQTEVLDFLKAIDTALLPYAKDGERLDLYLIGRSALIVRYGLSLATNDVDMVGRMGLRHLEEKALELFCKESANARQWRLYLEEVPQGYPPVPQTYGKRSVPLPGDWVVLRPMQPDVHDLAATKLKRFHTTDREDLKIMCDAGDLAGDGLERALNSAFAFSPDDEEDSGRKRAYQSLRQVLAYLDGTSRTL
jgi:hypothetical protein